MPDPRRGASADGSELMGVLHDGMRGRDFAGLDLSVYSRLGSVHATASEVKDMELVRRTTPPPGERGSQKTVDPSGPAFVWCWMGA